MKKILAILVLSISIIHGSFAKEGATFSCVAKQGKVFINFEPLELDSYHKVIISRTKKSYVFEEIAELEEVPGSLTFVDETPTEGISYYQVEFLDMNNRSVFTFSQGLYVPFRDGIFVNVHDYEKNSGEIMLNFLNLEKGRIYHLNVAITDVNGDVLFNKKYKVHCHKCIKTLRFPGIEKSNHLMVTNSEGEVVYEKSID